MASVWLKYASVTLVKPSDFFVGKLRKALIDLNIQSSVEASTPIIFQSTTGQRVPEDSLFIGYSINTPQADKASKKVSSGQFVRQYMSE